MKNLRQRLHRGPLSELELLSVARSVATDLSALHHGGVVHRDLRPEVILLLPGTVRLMGLEPPADSVEDEDEVLPTFTYAAPERTGMLKRKVDGRADLYALGVILFECATGAPPFQAGTLAELLHMHAAVEPPDAHRLNPAVRPILALMMAKLMAKDPDGRYQTCAGLLADLEPDRLAGLAQAQKLGLPMRLDSASPRSI